ncbi:MAG: A17 family peptidase, partial [Candidatus Omnitrophica bacterium]|nr:A17 family peptidase [Candidatus Omnitrophota bacterium]
MYLQIGIAPKHRPFFRYLWRGLDQTKEPEEYEFNRVVFGVNSSPFLAQFVAQEHARKYTSEAPLGAETILKSTYMDDGMDSVPDSDTGIQLYKELTYLWETAGMKVRKWMSNSSAVLSEIPPEDRAQGIELESSELPTVKTLGISWSASQDIFSFHLNPPDSEMIVTKRNFLRKLAAVFDPLGFLSPFLVRGKVLMQEIWVAGYEWDQEIVGTVEKRIRNWFEELPDLQQIEIPRCLRLAQEETVEKLQIHTFTDASQEAYGAEVYCRTTYRSGKDAVRLIVSKNKVAPLTTVSIPRLELMGATLGLHLTVNIITALQIPITDVTFWSDSLNVLWWIRGRSRQFKAFIANRVGEIQSISNPQQWRYVSTDKNPADLLTRGLTATDLSSSEIWWNGPGFLSKEEDQWPENPCVKQATEQRTEIEIEIKKGESTFVAVGDQHQHDQLNRMVDP